MQLLTKHFEKAKLPLVVTDKPFARGRNTKEIFQMTIEGDKPEQFKIYKGIGNDVKVVDADEKKRQVLLTVKEPKRTFIEITWDSQKRKNVEVARVTNPELRRYLCGMDERHLFISELPKDKRGKINTVDDAHQWLKPKEFAGTKRRKGAKVKRQGEWFFVDITEEERETIKQKRLSIINEEPLPRQRGGKPHTCDYFLRVGEVIFIKGKVRHLDHATIEFDDWQRVYRNSEPVQMNAVHGWID